MAEGRARTVLITGASTGIGEACALHLARRGFRVFAGVRAAADADRLRARAGEDTLVPVLLDVTDLATIAAVMRLLADATEGAGLAGLVNNAGIGVAGPLEFIPLDDLRRQLEVNVVGQVAVTQAALPLLRAGRGRVINMSSIGGKLAQPFLGPYVASKFALEALTDALRMELRPWSIEVIAIEPGAIRTPIWNKSLAAADDLLERLPPRAHELYSVAMERMRVVAHLADEKGSKPESVARAVERALTTRRPKTRYVVGLDARAAIAATHLLPDWLRDAVILRTARLPRSARDLAAVAHPSPPPARSPVAGTMTPDTTAPGL